MKDKHGYIHNVNELFEKIVTQSDEVSFRTLFYLFFSPLCVFAHRYVSNWETCEDLVQEAFLRIWEKRESIRVEHSVRNLLLTTVKNQCIDYHRREEMKDRWRLEKLEYISEDTNEDAYSIVELRRLFADALKKMPDEIKDTFELSRFQGKKHTEIAEIQRVNLRVVEYRMAKALKLLKEELKDYLPYLIIIYEFQQINVY